MYSNLICWTFCHFWCIRFIICTSWSQDDCRNFRHRIQNDIQERTSLYRSVQKTFLCLSLYFINTYRPNQSLEGEWYHHDSFIHLIRKWCVFSICIIGTGNTVVTQTVKNVACSHGTYNLLRKTNK